MIYGKDAAFDAELKRVNEAIFKAPSKMPHKRGQQLVEIIDALMRELEIEIFVHDENGFIVRNDRLRAKVNWWGVMMGIGKIIGKIIAIKTAYTELRTKKRMI